MGILRDSRHIVRSEKKGFKQDSSDGRLTEDREASMAKKPDSNTSSGSTPPMTPPSTPQKVVDRMFIRMVVCAALPVVLGVLSLPVFIYLKNTNEDFPIWVVYVAQNIIWGGGLLGITYGIISTSWDPTREGSLLGFDEFKSNLPVLLNKKQ